MTGLAFVLFLVLVPLSGLVIYTRQPRLQTSTHAQRPQARTMRPVQPPPPVVATPLRTLRRLPMRTLRLRQRRKVQRMTAVIVAQTARIKELEAKLLEQLVLAEV